MFRLNPNLYGSVFAVPTGLTDRYIKLASASALKVLLWILRFQNGDFSASELAERVGCSEAQAADALEYWKNEGVLLEDGREPEKPEPAGAGKAPLPPKEEEKPVLPAIRLAKPTLKQLRDRLEESRELAFILSEGQGILGRTFGFDMQSTLLMLYDTYGLKPEVILVLLQFCVQQGKASTAYIASLGRVWAQEEINTLEQADAYIQNALEVNALFGEFKTLTGISNPRPTAKQSEYLSAWLKLGFDAEMMAFAFEEAADRTGKVSFAYTNKILLNWSEQGCRTPADVEKGKREYREKKAREKEREQSYDISSALDSAGYRPPKYSRKEKNRK